LVTGTGPMWKSVGATNGTSGAVSSAAGAWAATVGEAGAAPALAAKIAARSVHTKTILVSWFTMQK